MDAVAVMRLMACSFLRSRGLVRVHANGVFVNQLSAEESGYGDQGRTDQRGGQTQRNKVAYRVADAQQPIPACQREQHHCKNAMTPCGDQAADAAHAAQVDEAGQTRNPAAASAHAGQPQSSPRPELIAGGNIGQIGGHQGDQGRDREVDQHRMQRVAEDCHTAADGFGKKFAYGHGRRIAVSVAGFTPLMLGGCQGEFSILDPAGPGAASVAGLWWGMLGFSTLVLLGICALWIIAVRRDPGEGPVRDERHFRRWIIGGGILLPTGSITLLLLFGIPAGHRMLALPVEGEEALRIDVTASQWFWSVHYPDQDIELSNTLYIPVGRPVDVHLTSSDVIHSFWVPRLTGKLDAIPGRVNVLRLQASEAGAYRGSCAEFCGLQHAGMQFVVHARSPEHFAEWLQEQGGSDD